MSNQRERDAIVELLLKEWKDYAAILDERGETWSTTDPMRWPRDSALWWLDHSIRCLMEAAKAVGAEISRAELERQHRERAEYRRTYPSGSLSLPDK
ncbi:hypothetical protein ACIQGT_26005 [Streptomyces sp. NPDC093108]|uniref:hypothetical protein n=1 Tax=Streptomyces sp. NPDC093108 TaxID=3366030 RepID=UPI00381E8E64